MIIIPGPASKELGEAVAERLSLEAHPVEHRLFPDGESYLRLTADVKGETVALVQSTAPDGDSKMMQLLIMARTAKDFGAERVVACVPYLAYMRQDKQFLDGEALSFDVVLSLLECVGVDDLVVVDLHSEESLARIQSSHGIRVHTLTAIPAIALYLKEHGYDGAYSLSPDVGRKDIVETASRVMGGGFAFFEKMRDRHTGETTMKVKDVDVKGRKAVVFDDIISSGGTMARAIKGLKAQGAVKVAAACTHALFMPGAEERLREAGADLILAADTVETPYSRVSVAGLIADHLRCL
ncbi:ribose-phosphate diphosphokinase [Candidatus Bathyarchaeota archaeon]|nr:ribose-phosphate diphosphokinase [Candidatus Bathyarchaeota archaeon]